MSQLDTLYLYLLNEYFKKMDGLFFKAKVFSLKWWVMISGKAWNTFSKVATQMAVLSSFLGWTINLNTHPTVSPKAKRALSAFWCQANDDASQTMLMDNYGFRNFQFSASGDSTWYAWKLEMLQCRGTEMFSSSNVEMMASLKTNICVSRSKEQLLFLR